MRSLSCFKPKKRVLPRLTGHSSILSKLERCKGTTQFNQIHGLLITTGLFSNIFAATRLILFTSDISLAHLLFTQIQTPDVYAYNTMVKAFSHPFYSITLYNKMLLQGLQPNEYTFCFLFTSCTPGLALLQAQQLHSHFLKHGFNQLGVFATTSLLHLYAQCGQLQHANKLFVEMPRRNQVSWGVLINGCISNGAFSEGFKLFATMGWLGIQPNNATLVTVFGACAVLQDLWLGRMFHGYILVRGFQLNLTLGTSLVHAYSKCGDVQMAMDVFRLMQVKSVVSWNCIISGLAMNGQQNTAINLFRAMQSSGTKPNSTTFLGVLQSCSHAGLVDDGLTYFGNMIEGYAIFPNIKHYGCMVDLYGRAGRIKEALELIKTMPMSPDIVIWGALLGACRTHDQPKLGELVVTQLMKLQPFNIAGCTSLSDVYAMAGQWGYVVQVRRMMMNTGILREPGFSSIVN